MSVRRVTDADGNQFDIDLEDDDWAQPVTPAGADRAPAANDRRWAEMRRDADAGKKAARELAFLRAGIDPLADPKHEDFMRAYDGDLTEERIRAAAVARGYLTPPVAPGTPPERTPEQAAALAADQAISDAGAGAAPHAPSGQQALTDAFAAGGVDAMLVKARELGLAVDPSYTAAGDTGPAGWGASG